MIQILPLEICHIRRHGAGSGSTDKQELHCLIPLSTALAFAYTCHLSADLASLFPPASAAARHGLTNVPCELDGPALRCT